MVVVWAQSRIYLYHTIVMDLSDRIIMRISSHLVIRILSLSLSSALIRRVSHAWSLCLHLHSFAWFCNQFCVRVQRWAQLCVYPCICVWWRTFLYECSVLLHRSKNRNTYNYFRQAWMKYSNQGNNPTVSLTHHEI